MKKVLVLITVLFLLTSSTVLAQDFCQGDFNYDGNVDAADVTTFLTHFGRSPFFNPCPPDGPAPVGKTGQTTQYGGQKDDGYYEKGVAWPIPRFTDNGDGTVTDNLTGLMWFEDANPVGAVNWDQAFAELFTLNNIPGTYGYTDWRLPNLRELQSLIDYSMSGCVLPVVHPFENVQSYNYWSSTTYKSSTGYAWSVDLGDGNVNSNHKSVNYYVWPVRGGQ